MTSASADAAITFEERGGVGHLRFNRPEGANVVNERFAAELRQLPLTTVKGKKQSVGIFAVA